MAPRSTGRWPSWTLARTGDGLRADGGLGRAPCRVWRTKLREAGVATLPTQPGWRTRVLIALANRFGPGLILPTIGQEQADSARYPGSRRHVKRAWPPTSARTPGSSAPSANRAPACLGVGCSVGSRHRGGGGNALRAAVLGANDGLVSNASLVMGVAGAELSGQSILITGLAGLMAGSLSMALGEWLSVQSARELFERQIGIEREELLAAPEEEAENWPDLPGQGLDPEQARELGQRLVQDHDAALDTLAREELGIDPEELGGSAWVAAITSFSSLRWARSSPSCPISSSQGPRRSSSASC